LSKREASHGGDLRESAVATETKCRERHARRLAGRQEEPASCDV
jgi:hypothetical protein